MGQDSTPCAGTASLAARAGNDLWFVDFGQFQCLAKGLEGCRGIGLTGKSLEQGYARLIFADEPGHDLLQIRSMVAAVPVGDTNDRLIVIGVTVCIRPIGVQRGVECPAQNSPPPEGWQAQPDGVVMLTDIPPGRWTPCVD